MLIKHPHLLKGFARWQLAFESGFLLVPEEMHLQKVISRSGICAVVINLRAGQNSQGEERHTHTRTEQGLERPQAGARVTGGGGEVNEKPKQTRRFQMSSEDLHMFLWKWTDRLLTNSDVGPPPL